MFICSRHFQESEPVASERRRDFGHASEWSPALRQAGIRFADVSATAIKGAELSAIVEAWKAGAISRESLLESLRRGVVLPNGRSVAQEKVLEKLNEILGECR